MTSEMASEMASGDAVEEQRAGAEGPAPPRIGPTLVERDPQASPHARARYAQLVALENAARSGEPHRTVIGQHIEAHNELYNPFYGDTGGTTYVGYHYDRAAAITGRHPGFLEIDVGPGYHATGWDGPRRRYADDAVDLALRVAKGGRVTVGMSFHQPWPTSRVKDYTATLATNAPRQADASWFARVVDRRSGTAEYRALLRDLSYLAEHLSRFAEQDIPVLLRPYHEMNQRTFWWGGQSPPAFQALWQITYDHLVGTSDLHNLIFVWAPLCWTPDGPDAPWDYYPSATPPDVVAVDYYADPDHISGLRESDVGRIRDHYTALAGYGRPRALAESYYTPLAEGGPDALRRSPWVWWTVWGDGLTSHNSPGDVRATYRECHHGWPVETPRRR